MADSDECIEKPLTRVSVLQKNAPSTYQAATKKGMSKPALDADKLWQAHHILSITCMDTRMNYYPDADKPGEATRYIEDCLWCADWKINDEPNMLGMPLNKHHRDTLTPTPPVGAVLIPSHQVDHNTANGYTKDVSNWLKKNLWSTLQAKQEVHKVDVKKIEKQLTECSKWFLNLLTAVHPLRDLGIVLSFQQRFQRLDTWFEPFSMAINPDRHSPGVSPTNFTGLFIKIQ